MAAIIQASHSWRREGKKKCEKYTSFFQEVSPQLVFTYVHGHSWLPGRLKSERRGTGEEEAGTGCVRGTKVDVTVYYALLESSEMINLPEEALILLTMTL